MQLRLQLCTLAFLCLAATGLAQPANDDCADAIAIGEVTDLDFSTIGATTDGPFHPDSPCPGGGDPDSLYNDIWYLYTPTFSGQAIWSMCGTANFDTKIAVYQPGSPCPPSDGDLINCNEDAGGCADFTSEIIFPVSMGETYLLRLAGYGEIPPGEEGSGTFTLEEFIPALENDFCSNAFPITTGEDQAFSTLGATTDGPIHPDNSACFGFGDNTAQADIWYTFTPDFTGTVEWSTCNSVNFDSRLAIYGPDVACPVEDGDLHACNDDGSACSDYTSRVIFDVEAGQTFILRIGGYDGETGTGTFDLVRTSPPTPPANNLCANAERIEVMPLGSQDGVEGTTLDATFDPDNFSFPICLPNMFGGEFAEVWYSFNSFGNTSLELTFGSATTNAQFYIDIWNACDGAPIDSMQVENACFFFEDASSLLMTSIGPLPEEPTEYIMRVVTRVTGALPGDFFFQLQGEMTSAVLDPFGKLSGVAIYPNPVLDDLVVSWELDTPSDVRFGIIDVKGSVLREVAASMSAGPVQYALPVGGLQSGLYLLHISMPEADRYVRFVKE